MSERTLHISDTDIEYIVDRLLNSLDIGTFDQWHSFKYIDRDRLENFIKNCLDDLELTEKV